MDTACPFDRFSQFLTWKRSLYMLPAFMRI
jgi:hypothetical protein